MTKVYKPNVILLRAIIKIVIILYSIYFVFITIFNMTLKETAGEITSSYQHESTTVNPYRRNKITIKYTVLYYKYYLNEKRFFGERYSNLLISPNYKIESYPNVLVYYCPLFPQYSVLFKGNVIYTFYNFLPILMLIIILFILTKKYDLKTTKTKKESSEKDEEIDDNIEPIDMEGIFIGEVKSGEKPMRFLDVLNPSSEIVIESLFRSEQIPYMIKYSWTKTRNQKYMTFYILERDYKDALFIIEEYVNGKDNDITIHKNHA